MEKSILFSASSESENLAVSKKTFILSLIVTGIYMIIGFKWFYTLLFGATLTEWQFSFGWPLYRFSLATCLFFLLPWYLVCKKWNMPINTIGVQRGNVKLGLILTAIGAVVTIGVGFSVAGDPTFKEFYPMERVFVDPAKFGAFNVAGFVIMETLYFFLYYIPYEFFFRGVSQFPLLDMGKVRTTWIVLYTTAITTAVHYTGTPITELVSAFAVGFIFGLATIKCRSIWYVLVVHAAIGIVTDFVCLFLLQGWM
jgi:hypothetical protein